MGMGSNGVHFPIGEHNGKNYCDVIVGYISFNHLSEYRSSSMLIPEWTKKWIQLIECIAAICRRSDVGVVVNESLIELAKSRKDWMSLTLRSSGQSRMVWTLAGSIVNPSEMKYNQGVR